MIANIVDGGGDANGTSAIGFDIMFNGKPGLTLPATATALSAVVAAGTVTGATKFTATPGASNHLGYKLAATLTAPNPLNLGAAPLGVSTSPLPVAPRNSPELPRA